MKEKFQNFMHRESLNIDEFVASTLVVLENNNLDPVFDYSQADEAAQKIIDEIFNDENAGKKLSEIISENQLHEEDLIYTKKGIFDHGIQDGELSTSMVGTNAIDFCKALIHLVREQLEDLETGEIFIPIALKWHIGVAVLNEENSNSDSIIVTEPSYSQWNDMQKKHLDEEWKEWGVAEYSNKDDFVNEYDWTDAEVFLRDTWQAEEINKITALLKIKSTLTNVNIKTEEMLSGEEEGEAEEGDEGLEDKIDSLADELEDLKAEFEKLLNDEEDEAGDDAEEIEK